MNESPRNVELRDLYRHANFYPSKKVDIAPWDDEARIIRLTRRLKKQSAAAAGGCTEAGMTSVSEGYEIFPVVTHESFLRSLCDG